MKRFLVLMVFLSLSGLAFGQYENEKQATIPLEHFYIKRQGPGFRKYLTKITWGLSTGYGRSYFNHTLDGFTVIKNPDRGPFIQSASGTQFTNWFNQTESATIPIAPTAIQVNANTEEVNFKGTGGSIPLKLTAHYEWKRYRIGAGYSYEYMWVGDFKSKEYGQLGTFSPNAKGGFMRKYFLVVGAALYRYQDYLLVADAQIGNFKPSRTFNMGQISRGLYYNIGFTIERDLSEYFKVFLRPSFELKSFTLQVPEAGGIKHRFNALYLNVGATYRIPDLRRCVVKGCKAQMNHAHGNKEYRSRVHPIYLRQNPNYGENHPVILKYKGKNKRKINPY
ncbi:MAG: hypothetical protein ACOVOF_12360 [Chryseotalea sp.]